MLTSLVFVASLAFAAADPCAQSNGHSSHCLEQAAKAGNGKAIQLLTEHYMQGPGQDPAAAERWMREGARQGDAAMALALGTLLLDPARSPDEQREGLTLLGPLAENGNVKAALKLAGYSRAVGNQADAEYWALRAGDAAGNASR